MDYASTTPMDSEVFGVMKKYFSDKFENPSSLYKEGVLIREEVEEARGEASRLLHTRPEEIIFTSGGTESDNLALLGIFEQARLEGIQKPHIIISSIEHPAIFEVKKEIEKRGGTVSVISVDEEGILNIEELGDAMTSNTVLVSIMYANNEIGTIQPITKISRTISKWKKTQGKEDRNYPFFHTDASQAPNYLSCDLNALGADMMTLDGSKIYGPKGIGCLIKKHYVKIAPQLIGGGQESGMRAGTENVPSIIGFVHALKKAQETREEESQRLTELRDYFISELLKEFKGSTINGSLEYRMPNNINICIPNMNAEFAVIQLDEKGIACSFMTACKNLDDESSSYVIEALGKKECTTSSLRFTLGRQTTKENIDFTIQSLKDIKI